MYRGYVKLWRKSFDSIIWKNQKLWRFWTWCLMKATHTDYEANIDYNKIALKPGQFLFGRKKCSQETGLSEQTIRTCVQKLNGEKLTVKSTNKYSMITIINWEGYQQTEKEINQENNQQVTSKQPASNQQVTTYKNVKNNKNVKNVKKTTIEYPEWLNLPLWLEYKKHRKLIKATMSELAETKAINKLKRLIDNGNEQERIIDQSIEMGWKGLFEVKAEFKNAPKKVSDKHKQSLVTAKHWLEKEGEENG